MSCKSAIYTANQSSQTVTADSTLSLGTVIRRFGSNVHLSGNGILLNGLGYYDVTATVTAAPSVTGAVSVSLYKDGSPIPGATATATAYVADESVTLPIAALVHEQCCDSASTLTLVLSGADSSVTNVSVVVEKV